MKIEIYGKRYMFSVTSFDQLDQVFHNQSYYTTWVSIFFCRKSFNHKQRSEAEVVRADKPHLSGLSFGSSILEIF
jgi:hypothetical protein